MGRPTARLSGSGGAGKTPSQTALAGKGAPCPQGEALSATANVGRHRRPKQDPQADAPRLSLQANSNYQTKCLPTHASQGRQ